MYCLGGGGGGGGGRGVSNSFSLVLSLDRVTCLLVRQVNWYRDLALPGHLGKIRMPNGKKTVKRGCFIFLANFMRSLI